MTVESLNNGEIGEYTTEPELLVLDKLLAATTSSVDIAALRLEKYRKQDAENEAKREKLKVGTKIKYNDGSQTWDGEVLFLSQIEALKNSDFIHISYTDTLKQIYIHTRVCLSEITINE